MSLNSMTVKDLRSMAADLGIRNRTKMRKAELITAIEAAQNLTQQAVAPAPSSSAATSTVTEAARPAFGPNGDPGLPIPDNYDCDRLVLMVQDPTNVHAYWEIRQDTLQGLREAHGKQSATVLLVHCGGNTEQRFVDLAAGNYYLSLAPDQDVHVELALRDEQGQLHIFLRSSLVRTPAHRISNRADVEWMDVNESFATLLDLAELGSNLTSADLQRRLETVSWEVPNLPSSDTLLEAVGLSSHNLSSSSLSSGSLSSTAWQPPSSQAQLQR